MSSSSRHERRWGLSSDSNVETSVIARPITIAVMAVIGAVIALETGGGQPPVQAGLVLTLAATALLLAPSTRSASGVG